MKKGFLRVMGVLLVSLLPALVFAENEPDVRNGDQVSYGLTTAVVGEGNTAHRFQDGKKSRQKENDKKPSQDGKKADVGKDTRKPGIKEVPKSRPKLKPKPVTDRIKIKRLPAKIKAKGLLRVF